MPLRLNWFPWTETKIWCSIRFCTALLQEVSQFLLSWQLNCHFFPELEGVPPFVLFRFSVESSWMCSVLALLGFDAGVKEKRRGSVTPFWFLSCEGKVCSVWMISFIQLNPTCSLLSHSLFLYWHSQVKFNLFNATLHLE